MKKTVAVVVIAALIPIAFLLGLHPAERMLTRSKPDSYVLIGTARGAMFVAGMCEFLVGAVAAAALMLVMTNRRITEQPGGQISSEGAPGSPPNESSP